MGTIPPGRHEFEEYGRKKTAKRRIKL